MDRAEKAVGYKHGGHNCCQAVLLAFADRTGLSEENLTALGAALGRGMGAFDATCGALCAAQMVVGLLEFDGRPLAGKAKELHDTFKEKCGSTDCGELKGLKGGPMLCPCDDCIRAAVNAVLESSAANE
ncbi:MAG: C_GCAxxG_C_C family protein [Ruminococcus sp.]|nr:C_GCAxxG_C_C family protein [Ruminococcus sp.]MBR1863722.1 C_GCAxxG_C_C family protein [Ruminococcus sp.]